MKLIKTILSVFIGSLLSLSVLAQETNSVLGEERVDIELVGKLTHSFSEGSRGIVRDEIGRYWISSSNGLNRYDGYELKHLYAEGFDTHSIVNNSIRCSQVDSKGNIWFGTTQNGLFKYDFAKEIYHKVELKTLIPDGTKIQLINGIEVDDQDNIWIAPPFKGIYKFNPQQNTLNKIDFNLPEEETPINYFRIENLGYGTLAILSGTYLFIGNELKGFESYQLSFPWINFSDMTQLHNGDLIFYGKDTKGLLLFEKKTRELKPYFNDLIFKEYLSIDQDNGILSNDTATYHYDISNRKFSRSRLDLDDMNEAVFDDFGNILASVGSDLVRVKFKNKAFEKIFDTSVSNIRKSSDDIFHFSSMASLYEYDTRSEEIKLLIDLSDHGAYIYNFHFLANGNLLVNTKGFGKLLENRIKYGEFSERNILLSPEYKIIQQSGWCRNYNAMLELDDGIAVTCDIWYDDTNKPSPYGVYYIMDTVDEIQGGEKSFYTVNYFTQLDNGEIWISKFDDGIAILSADQKSVREIKESKNVDSEEGNTIVGNVINFIFESRDKLVYLVGDKGLNIYNPNNDSYRFINRKDGLLTYQLIRMVEGYEGNMWMFTVDKVYKYNYEKDELTSYNHTIEFGNLDLREGELFMDKKGYIYIDGAYGLFKFSPHDIVKSQSNLNLSVSDLYINRDRVFPDDDYGVLDTTIIWQESFELNYDQRDIGFKFVAPDGHLQELEYYYRLNGYQEEFLKADQSRTVHFTNLNHGDYVFELKAKGVNGIWLKGIVNKKFTIYPPWYKTIWAYLLYGVFIFSVLYSIYRIRIKQLMKYELLRTKISSDLHDDVGTLLTSLAMQSEVLGLSADQEEVKKFEKLSNLSREAMARMRDTVWAIDSRKDNLKSLIVRIEEYIEEINVTQKFQISFDHSVSKESLKLPPDIRRNTYLIFKEALVNAFKHSNGNKLEIKLKHEKKSLNLIIRDNGNVDPSKIKRSGLGLSNMQSRSDAINGIISIDYINGFSINLKVPL